MKTIEYRVRPVTRYVVTCFEEQGDVRQVCTIGEFPNEHQAERVRLALEMHDPMAPELPSYPPPSPQQ